MARSALCTNEPWLPTVLLAVFSVRQSVPVGVAIMNILPYLLIIPLLAFVPRFFERGYRKNPLLQGDMTVDLATDELRVIRETSTIHRWDAIARAAETPEFFLFFVTKGSAHYLPKHAVPPAELPELRAFLRAHVPSGLL